MEVDYAGRMWMGENKDAFEHWVRYVEGLGIIFGCR